MGIIPQRFKEGRNKLFKRFPCIGGFHLPFQSDSKGGFLEFPCMFMTQSYGCMDQFMRKDCSYFH